MDKLCLDLSNEKLFEDSQLKVDNNTTIIFGKNGTGKSTLTKLIKEQILDYDIRIFQDFEGVIGENNRLNAVVLGEENSRINTLIERKNKDIEELRKRIADIKKETEQNAENADNLFNRYKKQMNNWMNIKKDIDTFCIESARKIKMTSEPQISTPNYNKNDFNRELAEAATLSEQEKKKLRQTLSISFKEALKLPEHDIDFGKKLEELNNIIQHKVVPKLAIEEISNHKNKAAFAEEGLKIHNANEKCAFCGNIVTSERIKKLMLYFSEDEVSQFRGRIDRFIGSIDEDVHRIQKINLIKENFYPEYSTEVEEIHVEILEKKESILFFLNELKKYADNKKKYLYETLEKKNLEIPESINVSIKKYNELVSRNNSSDLGSKQVDAKRKLRLDMIKELCEEYKYKEKVDKCDEEERKCKEIKDKLDNMNNEVSQLLEQIDNIEKGISSLKAETKNETILADKINQKLKYYVSFELVYLKGQEEQGFYQVRCNRTREERDIQLLSTGEKNIIAFLYFIEKLNVIGDVRKLPRLIVFDDPMNSNDDTMQYVIIDEIQRIIKMLNETETDDKLILLTHNAHFYINISHGVSYKKNTFLRLNSNGKTVKISRVDNEKEDFKTSYEVLWTELQFLYKSNSASPAMLLNPIRRIIETFTKFNGIDKNEMLSHVSGAQKLLNVNSHSIDDLEAELNGKNKEDIINMMRDCFEKQNAVKHFENHYKKLCG